jgi:DNA-3-methyladenine glycosylase II
MIRDSRPEVIKHLQKDKHLKKVIESCEISDLKQSKSLYEDLISSIVSQQLSLTAAKTIYNRFENSLDMSLSPTDRVLAKSVEDLRALGFSYQKANYVRNVAQYFDEHNLHESDWQDLSDDEIIAKLTQIKGVGKWTVEMILMFSLGREDVLPLDDLIVRNHMIILYGVDTVNKKQLFSDLTLIAESWRPYRTFACKFLWAGKGLDIFKV